MGPIEEKLSTAYQNAGISNFSMDKFYKDCRVAMIFKLSLAELKKSRTPGHESHYRDARFNARTGFQLLEEPDTHLLPKIRIPIGLLQEDEFLDIVEDLKHFTVRISAKAGEDQKEIHAGNLFALLAQFIAFYAPHYPTEFQSAFSNTRDYGIYSEIPKSKEAINMRTFHYEIDMRLPWVLHRFVKWGSLLKKEDSEIVICPPSLEEIKQAFPPDPNEEFFDTVSESSPPSKE